jgi:hypothetical protein
MKSIAPQPIIGHHHPTMITKHKAAPKSWRVNRLEEKDFKKSKDFTWCVMTVFYSYYATKVYILQYYGNV